MKKERTFGLFAIKNLKVGRVDLCDLVVSEYQRSSQISEQALIAVLTSGVNAPRKRSDAVWHQLTTSAQCAITMMLLTSLPA